MISAKSALLRLGLILGLVIVMSFLAFGQSGQGKAGGNPVPQIVEAPRVSSAGAELTGQPIDPKTYKIGPEDILFVEVWKEPDHSGTFMVRPDGKITLSLIGDLQAESLTPERLSAQITEALSQLLEHPQVTVRVVQVNSKKFRVTGQVNKPGSFPLVTPVHVFDAINDAGGFQEFANKKNIVILRANKPLKFNYNDFIKGKNPEQNILLENGDTIIVN